MLLNEPYARRRELLGDLPAADPRIAVPRHFTAEDIDPNELLAVVEEQGLEGLVAKRLESRYRPSQRSRAGRIGGLLLGAHDAESRRRYIGDVGTGFTERTLDELLDLLTPLERPTSPFHDEVPAARRRGAHWVEPRLVGQVVYR